MSIQEIVFYGFAAVTVLSALFILFTSNIIHAAFALMLTLLGVATFFIYAKAEILGVTQIMVYVGGVLVLIVFGVMLTNKLSGKALTTKARSWWWPSIAGSALFALIYKMVLTIEFIDLPWILRSFVFFEYSETKPVTNVQNIGTGLMNEYVLIFEIAAILLLAALIGAVVIAGNKTIKK